MVVGRRVSETDRVCAFVDLTFALGWGQVNKDIRVIGAAETKGRRLARDGGTLRLWLADWTGQGLSCKKSWHGPDHCLIYSFCLNFDNIFFMCVHGREGTHVAVREQFWGVSFLLPPLWDSGDWTRVIRLVQQAPLPTEPSHQSIVIWDSFLSASPALYTSSWWHFTFLSKTLPHLSEWLCKSDLYTDSSKVWLLHSKLWRACCLVWGAGEKVSLPEAKAFIPSRELHD